MRGFKMMQQRYKTAVSQIIGEIILLAIAITTVSVLYVQILSIPEPQEITSVTITGKIEDGNPVFNLQRGESLGPNTKLLINIAGDYNRSIYSLDQTFLQKYIKNQEWNIGEQIILPPGDIPTYKGPRVEGTIIDTKTNAIVFWGILLEGIVTQYKGGIWHLNESYWSGISFDVNDSSGNLNHGLAVNNPKIINGTSQPLLTKNKNGGFFNGINYIQVETSWSLNITDKITVEAWLKPNTSNFISCTSSIQEAFGYTPYIIHVTGTYYAVVSEDKAKTGMLQTVNISSNGEQTDLVLDNGLVMFGKATSNQLLRPSITQVKENMVLIAFNNNTKANDLRMELRTYNISSINGSIQYTGNNLVLPGVYTGIQNRPSLIKISDNLSAITYWTPSDGIVLKTLNVSSNGKITAIMTYNKTDYGYEPFLFQVYDQIYALAYRNTTDKGIIKTFILNQNGAIQPISSWTYSQIAAYEPSVTPVYGNVFAVVYRNNLKDPDGYVKTFRILSDGTFGSTPEIERKIFEDASCFDPCVVQDIDDSYSVVYSTKNDDGSSPSGIGMYIGFEIRKNGVINITDVGIPFDQNKCFTPIIILINDHIFAITYTGQTAGGGGSSGHPGWLITVAYAGQRGIFKGDSFMISSSTNQIEGRINNVRVYYNDTDLGTNWHHIALTYDGMYIRLYIDAGKNYSEKYYPNNKITLTKDDLYLGRNYHGYIDEIAIYERALTPGQLLDQYQNFATPRILEKYLK